MAYKNQTKKRSLRDAGYDYYEAVTADGVEALDNYDEPKDMDKDELVDFINDKLFDDDSVTGNASGSYWFSNPKSKECVLSGDNLELLRDAVDEFDAKERLADKFMDGDYEWMDVTIRCWVLGQVADKIADEYLEEKED